MKKFFYLSIVFITSVLMLSCKKDDTTSDQTNNNGQDELYTWFIDNGWHDAIVSYGNPCAGFGGFYMEVSSNGTIVGKAESGAQYYGRWEISYDYRLYSSFDKVKELENIPNDGYTNTFVCDNNPKGKCSMIQGNNTIFHCLFSSLYRIRRATLWIALHVINA